MLQGASALVHPLMPGTGMTLAPKGNQTGGIWPLWEAPEIARERG